MNLVGKTGRKPENWNKARKKDLTEKSPEKDKDQDFASETKGDRCKSSSDCMRPSKSSTSKSKRLYRKLKFQEKGRVESRIEEIRIFLSETTLNNPGYWDPKGWSPTTNLPRTEFFPIFLPHTK